MNQLVDLHDEHPIAFEHELIRHGLRWRDFPNSGFTWRDLVVIVTCMDPSGPLGLAVNPQGAVDAGTELARSMEHSLRWLVWSRSSEAEFGRPPLPWRFTWEEDDGYAADAMTVEEVNAFLGWEARIAAENERRAAAGLPLIPT